KAAKHLIRPVRHELEAFRVDRPTQRTLRRDRWGFGLPLAGRLVRDIGEMVQARRSRCGIHQALLQVLAMLYSCQRATPFSRLCSSSRCMWALRRAGLVCNVVPPSPIHAWPGAAPVTLQDAGIETVLVDVRPSRDRVVMIHFSHTSVSISGSSGQVHCEN